MSRFSLPAALAGLLLASGTAKAGWINEFHYDNTGSDVGEFVEIVLAPGESIADFSFVRYNGSGGVIYNSPGSDATIGFTAGTVTNEGYQFFSRSYPSNGLQNGAPDGFALLQNGAVAVSGGVTQFLSYEGSFTATNGAAAGLTSTDVGVSEGGGDPAGLSLQLTGTGTDYSDFTWTGPLAQSVGGVNDGQVFGSPAPVPEPSTLALLGLVGGIGGVMARRRRKAADLAA